MAMDDESNLRGRIERLRETEMAHLDLLRAILSAHSGNVFGVDFLVIAAIQRSFALIDGFIALVERENGFCALPLLRLQLDSVMRLFACSLVKDPHLLASHLLQDEPLRKMKAADGRDLTDHFLHQRLTERYPWATSVYQNTSGFVHLSRRHMIAPVSGVDSDSRSVEFDVGRNRVHWPKHEIVEALDAFSATTNALLDLCRSWRYAKVTEGEVRDKCDRDREAENR